METAYEVILNNNERVMQDMYGNLNTHSLMYKDECIFDGELHSNSAVDFSNCTSLFPNMHKYSQEQWRSMIEQMYREYADCTPRFSRHLNFVTGDKFDNAGHLDFHHRRMILDMFIVFGYHEKLFSWNNPTHFMLRVCDNCVVYRDWMV